jgi:membrane-associated phospholipid phosphatase
VEPIRRSAARRWGRSPVDELGVTAAIADTAPGSGFRARITSNAWLKFFGITAFITVFFGCYFLLLRFPLFGVAVMPLTAADRFIAFEPWAIGLYFSLWLYVSLPPALLRTRREVYAYGWLAGALAIAGLSIFLFWPTSIPPMTGIEWAGHPGFALLKRVDASQNACPSLHVAFAVFSGVWLDRILRVMPVGGAARVASAAWCIGIVYSTIATRQHVAVDVAAGTALGLLAGALRPAVLRWSRFPVEPAG